MPYMPKTTRPPWLGPARKAWQHGKRWEGYKLNAWKEFSWHFKIANPICATEGCNNPTYYTDHINREDKFTDPLNPEKCQPLCKPCGDLKSAQEGAEQRKKQSTQNGI